MDLASNPETLTCTECNSAIEGAGYLPATEQDGMYHPLVDAAVCDGCGFDDIGMVGCALELDDAVDSGPDDILLYVRLTGSDIEVVSATERGRECLDRTSACGYGPTIITCYFTRFRG